MSETAKPDPRAGEPGEEPAGLMVLLRYVLPGIVVVAGIVVMALGSEADLEGGGGIVSAGLAIFFINWLFRTGAAGDEEREAEDRAREYFDLHGRWPD
ncbi:MAG TPA: hypothetical protein VH061_15160 [Solirubrobacteraceae bacterium]|jgi:hypothetical protein|nr:hypothetical protein [Solirubrobacteraceae bacterium]